MQLKNDKGASAAGHSWAPGEVVEVDDELAAQLIRIQDGGFYNPDDHPDGFKGAPRFIGPEGPGAGTKSAEWPTDTDDPTKESTVAESPFVDPGAVEEVDPEGKRPGKRGRRTTQSEVDPAAIQSEVDPGTAEAEVEPEAQVGE